MMAAVKTKKKHYSGNNCVVVGCNHSYGRLRIWKNTKCDIHKDKEHKDCPCLVPYSLHRLPKNADLRRQWLSALNRKDFTPSRHTTICSLHFVDGTPTKSNPIPTLHLSYEKKVGGVKYSADGGFKCKVNGCTFQAKLCRNLIQHLKKKHAFTCERKTLKFNTQHDFNAWKEKEDEKLSHSHIVLASGTHSTLQEKVLYYTCNRSGNNKEKLKDQEKRQGAIKTRASCELNSTNSKVSMKVAKDLSTNHGHEVTFEQLSGSKRTRQAVAEILENLLTESTQSKRSGYKRDFNLLSKKDLHNIKPKSNISGRAIRQDKNNHCVSALEELHRPTVASCDIAEPTADHRKPCIEIEIDHNYHLNNNPPSMLELTWEEITDVHQEEFRESVEERRERLDDEDDDDEPSEVKLKKQRNLIHLFTAMCTNMELLQEIERRYRSDL